jgi:hypothetical protein
MNPLYINPDVVAYVHHCARAIADHFTPLPYAAFIALVQALD